MNEFGIGFLCGIISTLVIAVTCVYLYQKRNGIRRFKGALNNSKDEFARFLSSNINQTFHLDVVLTEKQNDEMKLYSNGTSDYFFQLPHTASHTKPGGYFVTIKSKGNDFFHDSKHTERRLKGHFYLEGLTETQHGWKSATLVASPKHH